MRPELGELPPEREKPMMEKGAEDTVVFADLGGDSVGEVGGIAERCSRRRLHDDEEVGLVLLRDERRGDVVVACSPWLRERRRRAGERPSECARRR